MLGPPPQTTPAPSAAPLTTPPAPPTRSSQTASTSRSSNSKPSHASRPSYYLKKISTNLKNTFTVTRTKKTQHVGPATDIDWHHQGVEVTKEDFIGLPSISAALRLYRVASPASLARVSREIDEHYEKAQQTSLPRSSEKASSGDA